MGLRPEGNIPGLKSFTVSRNKHVDSRIPQNVASTMREKCRAAQSPGAEHLTQSRAAQEISICNSSPANFFFFFIEIKLVDKIIMFHVYIIILHLYTLQSDCHQKCSYHPSPYNEPPPPISSTFQLPSPLLSINCALRACFVLFYFFIWLFFYIPHERHHTVFVFLHPFANTAFHSVGCLFIFIMVSLAVQKPFSLM